MSVKLSVNLNAIAMLRNRRDLPWPNVVELGRIALKAGANGLTVHPRPDERHIRFKDVPEIRALIDDEFPDREFNIEGYPTEEFLSMSEKYANQITLVPDLPGQNTSDHGFDFEKQAEFLIPIIKRLKAKNIRVSLFSNPSVDGLDIAKSIGADRVEFYTGPYGGAYASEKQTKIELEKLAKAYEEAKQLQLGINAGHDLTVANLPALVKVMPKLDEVSIGHGLIADALIYGMEQTVYRYKNAMV